MATNNPTDQPAQQQQPQQPTAQPPQPSQGYPAYPPATGAPPPEQQQYPQQGHAHPPQGYAPPPQGYTYPPPAPFAAPQGYPQPPQGHHPASPASPQQGQQPAQQPYGVGAPYNYPPPQGPPPQGGYWPGQPPTCAGYPQPQGYAPQGFPQQAYSPTGPPGAGEAALPPNTSPGYARELDPTYNPQTDAELIKKAIQTKFDLKALLRILPTLSPAKINTLRPLLFVAKSTELTQPLWDPLSTSGRSKNISIPDAVIRGLDLLLSGPCDGDALLLAYGLDQKISWPMNAVLLGRTQGDIAAVAEAYRRIYGTDLLSRIRGSFDARKHRYLPLLYQNALEIAQKPAFSEVSSEFRSFAADDTARDIAALETALTGSPTPETFALVFTTSSKARLQEIISKVEQRRGKSIEKDIKKAFDGEFEDALLYIVDGVRDNAKRDAKLIEGTMAGMGTRDNALVAYLIRAAWDKEYLKRVKEQFKVVTGKEMVKRIDGDTSGVMEDFCVAIAKSDL